MGILEANRMEDLLLVIIIVFCPGLIQDFLIHFWIDFYEIFRKDLVT